MNLFVFEHFTTTSGDGQWINSLHCEPPTHNTHKEADPEVGLGRLEPLLPLGIPWSPYKFEEEE